MTKPRVRLNDVEKREHKVARRKREFQTGVFDGNLDALLNTVQAAAYIGCSRQFLEIGRSSGRKDRPKHRKLSERMVRYRLKDIKKWIRKHKVV